MYSLYLKLAASAAIVAALGYGIYTIREGGVEACEKEHVAAANLAQEEAHQFLLAANARGDELAAKLAETQRRLNDVKTEYMAYANGISGNCPAAVGVLINSAVQNKPLPQAPGKPADPSATIGASLVAANIAENFGRANSCITQLNALIDWHTSKENLK